VSSIPGANTLFEGQQINGQTHKEERHRREEKTHPEERSKTQIKEDPSNRSKQELGPLRDTTSDGLNTL
jgi:hypothetical protein